MAPLKKSTPEKLNAVAGDSSADFVSAATQDRVARLERQLSTLRASARKLRETRRILQRKTHALGERVKELNCLYAMSSLMERHGISLDAILSKAVKIIAAAWQYPEITRVRISLKSRTFITDHFEESPWKQSADISQGDTKIGSLDVYYVEERPQCDEGPFLREERNLIDVIARRIGEIIEGKEADDALRESTAKNRALLAAIPDMMFRVASDGRILDFKPGKGFPRIGLPRKLPDGNASITADDIKALPKHAIHQVMKQVRQVIRSGETVIYEEQVILGDHAHHYEVLLTMSGKDEALGIVRDITERRRLERQVLEISEWEQQRIGQDLHDSLCQQLAGIGFLEKVLQQKLAAKSLEESADASEMVSLIDDAITQTKGLARGLYPVRLEAGGLVTALSELCRNVEKRFGVACTFECTGPALIRDNIVAIHLYRIAQEAVNNAIRHGKPSHIALWFSGSRKQAVLEISNDGRPFPKVLKQNRGMGLGIMRHRAAMIGASLDVRAMAGGGTVVTCVFHNRKTVRGERGQ
jgi:signal transduction histidine kinase